MTNAEKFEEVFGTKPDINTLVLDCPRKDDLSYFVECCQYYDDYTGQCHCDEWWYQTYKGGDDKDKKTTKVKEVALSTLEKGQKFYFKNFQGEHDECEVCYRTVTIFGIEVYYKYVGMPNRTFCRYGDDIIVIVKEALEDDR